MYRIIEDNNHMISPYIETTSAKVWKNGVGQSCLLYNSNKEYYDYFTMYESGSTAYSVPNGYIRFSVPINITKPSIIYTLDKAIYLDDISYKVFVKDINPKWGYFVNKNGTLSISLNWQSFSTAVLIIKVISGHNITFNMAGGDGDCNSAFYKNNQLISVMNRGLHTIDVPSECDELWITLDTRQILNTYVLDNTTNKYLFNN